MDDPRTAVAALLDGVAEHSGPPVPVSELCRRTGLAEAAAETAAPMVFALLSAFGALDWRQDPATGEALVAAVSPQAGYLLRSLSAYVRTEQAFLDNWERPGTADPPLTDRQALSGPQFLHLLEKRRLRTNPDAPPLRRVDVAQVVVKNRVRGRGGRAQYLMLYDGRARQYQLPGGYVRASDRDARTAAVRELEEELPGYSYVSGRDTLTELGVFPVVQISRTHGAVTAYRVALYQLRSGTERLPLAPGALWVPEETLLDPAGTVGGATLNITALLRLDRALPGGIGGLPQSMSGVQHRPLREVVRDRPWEVVGLLVGVVGLLVSLVPLLW
ncbi:NUDIX domain-containing protein [Streptomyces pini]|uniref:8-oxo-dGTP pyrophosphatase MutT, NUDIX family n=1 Tax=Streptomyces pini TaxID=1520580 RepID=A0A1I3UGK4_9ACTN|nr:NUDIX hydrolase [Streptomyces pini]SFJ80996.1 8-oxo-dGTP pyrophosphatase MutT, NUDIX family [Streptomyces pini]